MISLAIAFGNTGGGGVRGSLRVGSTGTTIEVIASNEQLRTDSSSVSSAIKSEVIDAISNVTQNPLYYVVLSDERLSTRTRPFQCRPESAESVRIRERVNLQIAADATNVLNHTEYYGNLRGGLGATILSGPATETAPRSAPWASEPLIRAKSPC